MNEAGYIASRLREIRTEAGLTQGQLAERVEVSRQTINYVENGTYCPSTYLALRIARELGVHVEDIFSLKDTE
ncbi:MAG: helix-turn-helix transcriptional regulator [Proteobacteria bacterium]|jgi:putative transcriptional regulator|nr:helix-turn-helix transcriptional regulator [Pseudomonadota bacterium]